VSDIGILNSRSCLAVPASCSAEFPALLWRSHRVGGAFLGAVVGFILWLAEWMFLKDVI
jgi:hypothetical protein